MPTLYTDCDECNYSDRLHRILGNNNSLVTNHYKNINILNSLIKLGIPKELCEKIVKMSNTLRTCSLCTRKLCDYHYDIGTKNLNYYRGYDNGSMCDKCCWFEVT